MNRDIKLINKRRKQLHLDPLPETITEETQKMKRMMGLNEVMFDGGRPPEMGSGRGNPQPKVFYNKQRNEYHVTFDVQSGVKQGLNIPADRWEEFKSVINNFNGASEA